MGLPLIQAYPFKLGAQTAAQQAAMSRLNANKTQNDMTNISKHGLLLQKSVSCNTVDLFLVWWQIRVR